MGSVAEFVDLRREVERLRAENTRLGRRPGRARRTRRGAPKAGPRRVPQNPQIADDAGAALTRGRNCLVLTRRVAQVEALTALLAARGHQAFVLQGAMSTSERRTVFDQLDGAKTGDGLLVIGTTPFIGEGFDAPSSTPFSSPARSPTTAYSSNAAAASSAPRPARTSPRSTTTTTRPHPSSPPHSHVACPDTRPSTSPGHERIPLRSSPGSSATEIRRGPSVLGLAW